MVVVGAGPVRVSRGQGTCGDIRPRGLAITRDFAHRRSGQRLMRAPRGMCVRESSLHTAGWY